MKAPAQEILEQAKRVLYGNLKTGYSSWAKTNYKYVCPAKTHYSHQWFWDSCFHAIVLSNFDIELAKNELVNLTKVQRPDGFIPHMIYWEPPLVSTHGASLESKFTLRPRTTELIQPPLLAEATSIVYRRSKDKLFLLNMVPKLVGYYRWLAENRDPDDDGLISIIAPYESGMDQSPSYDQVCQIRAKNRLNVAFGCRRVTFKNMVRGYNLNKIFDDDYFNVEDVLVNSIYIRNLKILSRLLTLVEKDEEARKFLLLAEKGKAALQEKCFDTTAGFFFDNYSKNENHAASITIKGLMPLLVDIDKKFAQELVKKHLNNKKEFSLPYSVPTVAANDPDFQSSPGMILGEPIIWRGPTWINTNWYLVLGLKEHGFASEAEKIIDTSLELVSREGFREFFDPFTGKGYGTHNFSWSTLVVDMMSGMHY